MGGVFGKTQMFRKGVKKHRTRNLSLEKTLKKYSYDVGTCRLWMRSTNLRGYGELGYKGYSTSVHIHAYKLWRGEVPKDMTVNHLCRHKACINPDHLEVTSRIQNKIKGAKRNLICLNGHRLLQNSIICYFKKTGQRECKKCQDASKSIHGFYYA